MWEAGAGTQPRSRGGGGEVLAAAGGGCPLGLGAVRGMVRALRPQQGASGQPVG